jgi:hypothetical protein
MAEPSIPVIEALRNAAQRLQKSGAYQWGHMGHCNCGFLAQVVTQKTADEIHTRAMHGHGDWSEQLNDYCPSTGLPMDDLIDELLSFGFERDDLRHLERLSDPQVLSRMPDRGIGLKHNRKEDVIAYLRAWSGHLESLWVSKQPLRKEAFTPAMAI